MIEITGILIKEELVSSGKSNSQIDHTIQHSVLLL